MKLRRIFTHNFDFSCSFIAAKTLHLLSDMMNHCQEVHPELERGPPAQLGSANYFRWVLGSCLCTHPHLVRSILLTGHWIVEDEKSGQAMVAFHPRSEIVPTEDEPGIMKFAVDLEAEVAGWKKLLAAGKEKPVSGPPAGSS